MKEKTTYMIFNNMKQYDLLVKVFILVKFVELRLKRIKAIYQKIWQNLMINLDQDQKKVSKKRDTYESVNALYEGRELTVNAFKSEIFSIKQHKVKGSKYELLNKYFKDYQ